MKLTAEPHLSLWFSQSKSPFSSFAAPPHTQLISGGIPSFFPSKLLFILFAWPKPPTQVGTSCKHIAHSCQRSKQANWRLSPFFRILQIQPTISSPALLGNTCCSPPYTSSYPTAVGLKYLPLLTFIPKYLWFISSHNSTNNFLVISRPVLSGKMGSSLQILTSFSIPPSPITQTALQHFSSLPQPHYL